VTSTNETIQMMEETMSMALLLRAVVARATWRGFHHGIATATPLAAWTRLAQCLARASRADLWWIRFHPANEGQ
jgi:hypothetical protein